MGDEMTAKEQAEKIEDITKRIKEGFHPEKIVIFGSYARGDAGPNSDLDILIVKEINDRPVLRRRKVLQLLKGAGVPKDIFVLTPAKEFELEKDLVGTVAYEANHFGKVVYGS
jgi:predicted nucleotidyltransferase